MAGIKFSPTCVGVSGAIGFLVIFFGVWAGEEAFHKNHSGGSGNQAPSLDASPGGGKLPQSPGHQSTLPKYNMTEIEKDYMKARFSEADYESIFGIAGNESDTKAFLALTWELDEDGDGAADHNDEQAWQYFRKTYRSMTYPSLFDFYYESSVEEFNSAWTADPQFKAPIKLDEAASKKYFMKSLSGLKESNMNFRETTYTVSLHSSMDLSPVQINRHFGLGYKGTSTTSRSRTLAEAAYDYALLPYRRLSNRATLDWTTTDNPRGYDCSALGVYSQVGSTCYATAAALVASMQHQIDNGQPSEKIMMSATQITACTEGEKRRRVWPENCEHGDPEDILKTCVQCGGGLAGNVFEWAKKNTWVTTQKYITFDGIEVDETNDKDEKYPRCADKCPKERFRSGWRTESSRWSLGPMPETLTIRPVDEIKMELQLGPVTAACLVTSMLDDATHNKVVPYVPGKYGRARSDTGGGQIKRDDNGLFYDPADQDQPLNHEVVIVGYGHDSKSKLDYWKVQNSWGVGSHGGKGYFKVQTGKNLLNLEVDIVGLTTKRV